MGSSGHPLQWRVHWLVTIENSHEHAPLTLVHWMSVLFGLQLDLQGVYNVRRSVGHNLAPCNHWVVCVGLGAGTFDDALKVGRTGV